MNPTQTAAGTWTVRVSTGRTLPSGGYETVRVTAGTKRAVEAKAAKVLELRGRRRGVDATDPTLAVFAEQWLDWQTAQGHAAATVATNRWLLAAHWLPDLGRRRLTTITAADINACLGRIGGKLSTAARSRGALRSCFSHAWRLGLVPENVVKRSFPPTGGPTRRMRPPSAGEVERAIVAARKVGVTAEVLVRLALDTGARRGELCALRWSDVDLTSGVVDVSRSLSVVGRQVVEKGTKTGSVKRLQVTSPTLELLRVQHSRLTQMVPGVDALFVVADDPCVPWLPGRAGVTWARIADRAGIPDVHLHDLRHRFVSELLAAGMSATDVAELAGHSRVTTTLNVYGHAASDAAARAAGILAGNVKSPDPGGPGL